MAWEISYEFLGGTADGQNMTGSCTLLSFNGYRKNFRILIDAGLIQTINPRKFFEENLKILSRLNLKQLDVIVVTHAHADHALLLALLVRHGFKGRIICTKETAKIIPRALNDSVKIQAEDSRSLNKEKSGRVRIIKGKRVDKFAPLYNGEDVQDTCKLILKSGFAYNKWYSLIGKELFIKFYKSGHMIGGAICVIRLECEDKKYRYFGFTGDLGRQDGLILAAPQLIKDPLDVLVIESTYGDKSHPDRALELPKLFDLIKESYHKRGRVIIPAFALHRTQELLYLLSYYMHSGEIPKMPIYADSPSAAGYTQIYAESWREGKFTKAKELKFNPFCQKSNKFLTIITNPNESALLAKSKKSCIIISSSGMCNAGRIRNHLQFALRRREVAGCLVGYMSHNTLGGILKNGSRVVKVNGYQTQVNANIVAFASFSGHADGPELSAYAEAVLKKKQNQVSDPRVVFITHGEASGAAALKAKLDQLENVKVLVPKLNEKHFV